MSSKYAFGWLMVLAMCVALFPSAGQCAQWNVSPFRAQLASADPATSPTEAQVATPDSGTSVMMTNPLKKNIGKAALFSLIIPGAGELYAGSWVRALPFVAAEIAGWAYFATYHGRGNTETNTFEAYAGPRDQPNHFDTRAYMYAEFQVAQDTLRAREVYHGDFNSYQQLIWQDDNAADDRYRHLPAPFTHDVMTDDQQQFFEMIGKYFLQFGWGWQDTYNGGGGYNPNAPPNWAQPASGLRADSSNTIQFDGDSPMFFHYRDLRGLANSYYNKGNVAMEVVLVNHLLSALDAAFAVRAANKHLEKQESEQPSAAPKLGHLHLQYDARVVNGNVTRFLTASLPLN